jgi:hypothetical protein
VGGSTMEDPDIVITQRGRQITLGTREFTADIEVVTFRIERTYLR